MDSYKSAQLMKYLADKGFKLIFLNPELYNNIAYDFHKNLEEGSISPDDELLKFVQEKIPNKLAVIKPLFADKKGKHADHFHIRLEGSGRLGDVEDRKAGEDSDSKEREKEREKSKLGRSVFDPPPPKSFEDDFQGGGYIGFKQASQMIHRESDFQRWFVSWLRREMDRAGNKFVDLDGGEKELTEQDKKDIFTNIIKYAKSGYKEDVVSDQAYQFMSFFVDYYNDGGRDDYGKWLKENLPLPENKRNNMMKITKEKLAQIIKEEVEAYKASQLSEIDVDELEEAEAYIKEVADLLKSTYETIFKGAAPAIGTPQTKADTGEPVTDQTAHEDAKGLLLDLLGDAIDEFQQKEPELNEDGHDDVPSAVRAMKTMAEDALEMLDALEQMDGSLPTWWTNKMAVSASMLNKMRDYLLVPSMEEEMDEQ